MQLIFVSPHSDPQASMGEPDSGGQCVYEHQLALHLAKTTDFQVLTFCRQTQKRASHTRIAPGYDIYRLKTGGPNFVSKETMEGHLPAFVQGMINILKKTINPKSTLIHAHYWDGGKTALMLKHNYHNLPLVWTPHSLGPLKRENFPGFTDELTYRFLPRILWENYTSFAADRLIVSSDREKQYLMETYSLLQDHIDVIIPGLNLASLSHPGLSPSRQLHQLPEEGLILLVMGRLSPSKGYHHAIHLLNHLSQVHPTPVYLSIVGGSLQQPSTEEKSYLNQLHRLVRSFNLEDQVFFIPAVPHEQVGSVYGAANLFLLTSSSEPFGLTVAEAMSAGCPVVVPPNAGASTLVNHLQTGLVVEVTHYQHLASQISSLAQKGELAKMGKTARTFARKHLSWSSKIPAFIQSYRNASLKKSLRFQRLLDQNYFLHHNLAV